MSRKTLLLRSVLFLVLFSGLALMVWPLGQTAYGWWNQRTLRARWQHDHQVAQSRARQNAVTPDVTAHPPAKPASPEHIVKLAASAPKSLKQPAKRIQPWPDTRIVIPDINIDAIVVQGMDTSSLRRGPGHDSYSASPGQAGNCVIAGHRNVFGAWFADLDKIWAGSVIELHTPDQIYTYHVINTARIGETDTSVLAAPPADAPPRLTLITCTVPAGFYRHVVVAELTAE